MKVVILASALLVAVASSNPLVAPFHDTHQNCDDGSQPVRCFANPCDVASCKLNCVANYCGGCFADCQCHKDGDCAQDEWCRRTSTSGLKTCTKYQNTKDSCGGATPFWTEKRCAPAQACGYFPSPFIFHGGQLPGVCLDKCGSSADCINGHGTTDSPENFCGANGLCLPMSMCLQDEDCGTNENHWFHAENCVGAAKCSFGQCSWVCGVSENVTNANIVPKAPRLGATVGGWIEIDPSEDPAIANISAFALSSISTPGARYLLISVMRVKRQIVAGRNYDLSLLIAKEGAQGNEMHNFIVFMDLNAGLSVSAHSVSSMTPIMGGWMNLPVNDTGLGTAVLKGLGALVQDDQTDRFDLVRVVNGRAQLVAGMKYMFELELVKLGHSGTEFHVFSVWDRFGQWTVLEHHLSGTANACGLAQKVGPCKASIPRYWYNSATKQCEAFSWGGCLANGNNYPDQATCEQECSSP